MDPFSSCTDLIRIGTLRIFLWILGTIAVGGNILVLLLRILTKEPTTANTTIITSLAVSDLLMGVYLYIIAAADTTFRGYYIEVDWTWWEVIGCKIAGVLSVLSSEVSVFTLTIISVDRFLVVVFPFSWEYSVAIFLGLNLVEFMIIAVLYTWMYVIIKRSADVIKHKTSRKKGENKELVVARKMALIILTDFACWMPIIILGLAAISGRVTIPGDVYAWIAVFVLPINSAMNPILYTLSSLDLIKLICGKKEPQLEYSGSTRTNVSTLDEDDEDGSPKVVNCYPEGSHLLPYVVEESNMLNLAHAMKTETPSLPLRDMRSVLKDMAKAMASLHEGGLIASSVTVNDVGIIVSNGNEVIRRLQIQTELFLATTETKTL
ncbi:G-protein coupled receptor GRL101-like [Lineus longissimus]|uniref:G-protein coupled receptor GRL101-like n=1 Tax=Lineus longissimus TaxID=88925 RepID=UPI00315C53F7